MGLAGPGDVVVGVQGFVLAVGARVARWSPGSLPPAFG